MPRANVGVRNYGLPDWCRYKFISHISEQLKYCNPLPRTEPCFSYQAVYVNDEIFKKVFSSSLMQLELIMFTFCVIFPLFSAYHFASKKARIVRIMNDRELRNTK